MPHRCAFRDGVVLEDVPMKSWSIYILKSNMRPKANQNKELPTYEKLSSVMFWEHRSDFLLIKCNIYTYIYVYVCRKYFPRMQLARFGKGNL